jgi:hypothetical protein
MMVRVALRFALVVYCFLIFLALDAAYSAFLHDDGRSARIADPVYHHGLAPNFDGYENWGDTRFRVFRPCIASSSWAIRSPRDWE